MRRPRDLVRRLARLRAHDVRDFVRAQGAVLVAHWLMWRRPTGQLLADGAAPQRMPSSSGPVPADVTRLLRAVNRASIYGLTRPKCLARSVALLRLLEADGHTGAALRIGVKWENGDFVAHAWVEYRGAVLDLDPSLHRPFVPLTSVRVASLEGRS